MASVLMGVDDINPLDVTAAYVSEINHSKIIKYLANLWLGHTLLKGRPKDHDIQVTVIVR